MFLSRLLLFLPLGLVVPLSPVTAAVDTCRDQTPSQLTSQTLDLSHHMPLQRVHSGMVGYGVTAMPGNPVTKFQVDIVDVLRDFAGPGRHVILANCSGAGLEKTGILAGMSGSPVYVPDPEDGNNYKMIGAVAYGWSFNKEPLCGIQPIEQMLTARTNCTTATLADASDGIAAEQMSAGIGPQRTTVLQKLTAGWRGGAAGLDPLDVNGVNVAAPGTAATTKMFQASAANEGGLQPLSLPLAVAGGSDTLMAHMQELFAQTGLMPVSTASASGSHVEGSRKPVTLKPGDPCAVLLAWGDMDVSAVGTVTEVLGNDVYAFGHSFNADGAVSLPLAVAEVKGRVASMEKPFKIASAGEIIGTFLGDQHTAIYGRMGQVPPSIPVEVTVKRPESTQTYHYRVAQHPFLTPMMTAAVIESSLVSQKKMPDRNTIRYTVDVDYGLPGRYRSENLVSAATGMQTMSTLVGDIAAPVAGLTTGPQGPIYPKTIKAEITLTADMHLAKILDAKLLTPTVYPGGIAQVGVRYQGGDGKIFTRSYTMNIPTGAAPGRYRLSAGSWQQHLSKLRTEQPNLFDPHSLDEMMGLLNLVGATRQDRLYLRLVSQEGAGLSVAGQGMPNLPGHWGKMLADSAGSAAKPDYVEATVKQIPLEFALSGAAEFELNVEKIASSAMLIP
jgi:hypothetical protein